MLCRIVHRYVFDDPERNYFVGIDPGTRNLGIAVTSRGLREDESIRLHYLAHVDLGEDVGRDLSFVLASRMVDAFTPVVDVLLGCDAQTRRLTYATEQQQKQRPDAFMVGVAGMLSATFYALWEKATQSSVFFPALTHIQPTEATSARVQKFLLPTFDPLPMNGRTEKKKNTVSVVQLWMRMIPDLAMIETMDTILARTRKRKNGETEIMVTGDVRDHPCDAFMMTIAAMIEGMRKKRF